MLSPLGGGLETETLNGGDVKAGGVFQDKGLLLGLLISWQVMKECASKSSPLPYDGGVDQNSGTSF